MYSFLSSDFLDIHFNKDTGKKIIVKRAGRRLIPPLMPFRVKGLALEGKGKSPKLSTSKF